MNPTVVGIIGICVLLALAFFRVPLAICLITVGATGLWYLSGSASAVIQAGIIPFSVVSTYDWSVLPLFLLMAHIAAGSGVTKDLYDVAAKWLGSSRGGLAMSTVGASALFAGISGSSIASAATMGLITIPEMKRYKYSDELATGVVAAGGTLGVLIPPSTTFILFGILTGTSIGKLFIAGIIPGIIEAVLYIGVIFLLCTWKPHYGPPGPKYDFLTKIKSLKNSVDMIVLVGFVLGGLLIGWFTASEAGAIGAFGAITLALLRKRLPWQHFKYAVAETVKTTGMIFFILCGAFLIIPFIALTNIPNELAEVLIAAQLPPLAIIICIMFMYLVLGSIMDVPTMIVITVPILFPVVTSLGFDPIWFGVLTVSACEIGMITPPIGMNVFVVAGVAKDVPMTTIFKGVAPFLVADVLRMALYILIPSLILFLPGLMMK